LPPEIRDLFEGFKPYKGGNNALWALNEMANAPKHMTLYPVSIGSLGVAFDHSLIPGVRGQTFVAGAGSLLQFNGIQINTPTWDSAKNEMVFARYPDGVFQGDPNFDIAFSIALDDVDEVICGQNPVSTLHAMAGEVERVLMDAEVTCRRIRLIT
jgi:hypothetical protein